MSSIRDDQVIMVIENVPEDRHYSVFWNTFRVYKENFSEEFIEALNLYASCISDPSTINKRFETSKGTYTILVHSNNTAEIQGHYFSKEDWLALQDPESIFCQERSLSLPVTIDFVIDYERFL